MSHCYRSRPGGIFCYVAVLLSVLIGAIGCVSAPSKTAVHLRKGQTHLESKRYDKAISEFKIVLEKEPDNLAAYEGLVSGYEEKGNHKEAIKACRALAELVPGDADVHYKLGGLYCSYAQAQTGTLSSSKVKNILKQGIKEFQKTIELNPSHEPAKEMLRIASGAAPLNPSEPNDKARPHFQKAEQYFAMKQYEKAIEEYERAIELDPKFAPAYLYLGDAYFAKEEYFEAIAWYRKSLEIDPNDARAWRYLGNAYEEDKRLKDALAAYKKSMKLDPGYSPAKQDYERVKRMLTD